MEQPRLSLITDAAEQVFEYLYLRDPLAEQADIIIGFGHFDMKQVRGISLREAAALQSFPDDYVFYPSNQIDQVAKMIGNAVPPKLARFFADYLISSAKR